MSYRSGSRLPKRYAFFTGSFVFAASDASTGTQPCPGAQNSAQQWYPGTEPSFSGFSGKPMEKRTGIPSERASAMNAEWKSVQFPFFTSQNRSESPLPQPGAVLSYVPLSTR